MAGSGGTLLLHQIRKMVQADAPALQDEELLDQFVNQRDPLAFATLVERHGPLVLAVGRRVLQESHAAEDVFQATFFVLARKASSIRKRKSLPSWLHGVAFRLAQKARTQAVRRQLMEKQQVRVDSFEQGDEAVRKELYSVLDEELERMPESLRIPLVLCYLQGRTRDQTASMLGWSLRTLHRRLDQGRNLLRTRLHRRGVVISATLLAATLDQAAAPATVPAALLANTCAAGIAFATGGVIDAACTRAAAMATGAIQAMHLAQIRIIGTAVVAISALTTSGAMAYRAAIAAKTIAPAHEEAIQPGSPTLPKAPTSTVQAEDKRADSAKQGVKTADPRDGALREKEVRNRVEALLKEAITKLEDADGPLRNRVLADIGALQGRLGNRAAALKTLEKAGELVKEDNLNELRELAKSYANAGETEGALEIIKHLPNPKPRSEERPGIDQTMVLEECASILAKARNEKDALRFADLIEDEKSKKWIRPMVLTELIHALAKSKDFNKALRMLDKLPDTAGKIQALTGRTYRNLSFLEDPHEPGIAILQAQAGDPGGARKSLNLAIELAGKLPKDNKSQWALASIVMAQARLGDQAAALEFVDRIDEKTWKDKALVAIARAYAAGGMEKEARQIIDSLHDPEMKCYGLYQLALGEKRAGNIRDARESLEEACKVATSIGKETNPYYNIVVSTALIGDYEKAIEAAREYQESNLDFTLCGIAGVQADAGDLKGALETVQKVDRDGWWKGKLLRHIAMKDVERRKSMDPPDWLPLISSPYDKANVLLGVAEGLAERIKVGK